MTSHRLGRHRRPGQGVVSTVLAAAVGAVLVGGGLTAGLGSGAASARVEGTARPVMVPDVALPAVADEYNAPVPAGFVEARVRRVVDGDTFVLDDGQRVRVVGIDSCETDTDAGARATDDAIRLLSPGTGVAVRLRSAGRDRDQWGRKLRYVQLIDSRDFGSVMVGREHSGVYEGRNDASDEYVQHLRSLDRDGRTCD